MFGTGNQASTFGESGNAPDRNDLYAAMGVALASLAFHLLYFNHGVHNLLDLALPAVNGARILDGDVYGVDFQAPYGPARYYLIALVFTLFGKSLFVLNGLFLAVMSVNNALTYLVARYLAPRPYALFAAALAAVAHGSIHKGFFILAGLLVLHALFVFIHSGGGRGSLRLGVTLAAVFLLRWDVGIIGAVAAIAALILLTAFKRTDPCRSPLRIAGRVLLGFGVLGAPALLAFLFLLDPMDFIDHTLHRVRAFAWYKEEYPAVIALLTSTEIKARLFLGMAVVLLLAMAACLALGLLRLRSGQDGRKGILLITLALVGFPLLNQVLIILRFNRFIHAAPPFFIAFAFLLFALRQRMATASSRAVGRLGRLTLPLAGGTFAVLMLYYLWNFTGLASQDSFAVLRYEERYIALPRARCYVRTGLARDLENALACIEERTAPGGGLYTGPTCPLRYFLADRPNPTRYLDCSYYYFNPRAEARIIQDLEAADVRLYVDWPRSVTTCTFEEACPNLSVYLKKKFKPVKISRRFTFWERRFGVD